jgi:YtkA-like
MIAEVTLLDATGKPVHGAALEIEGHMSHPGMAPVLATAEERRDGVYAVRFQFPMAGDWIMLVKGSLPDGRTLNHRIDIANVRPSG